jgi:hypothetical protein
MRSLSPYPILLFIQLRRTDNKYTTVGYYEFLYSILMDANYKEFQIKGVFFLCGGSVSPFSAFLLQVAASVSPPHLITT